MWFSKTGFLISSIVVLLSPAAVATTQEADSCEEFFEKYQITDPETQERFRDLHRDLEWLRLAGKKLKKALETGIIDEETEASKSFQSDFELLSEGLASSEHSIAAQSCRIN